MPKPRAGESKEKFISRCIPIVISEGKPKKEAAGKCYGIWESSKGKKDMNELEYKQEEYPFEIKEYKEEDNLFTFKGYASTYNPDVSNDVIIPGAYTKSITKFEKGLQSGLKKVKVLWQHKTDIPIGVPRMLKEDDNGLFVDAILPKDDAFVRDRVIPQMKIGSVDSMSIGFYVLNKEKNDIGGRNIKDLDLMEFSLVTFPANKQSNVTEFKSLDIKQFNDIDIKELEQLLIKGVKFSQTTSKRIIALIKDSLQREAVNSQEQREAAILLKKINDFTNSLKIK